MTHDGEETRHPVALALLQFDKGENIAAAIRAADAACCREVIVVGRGRFTRSGATNALTGTPLRKLSTIDDLFEYAAAEGYDPVAVEIAETAEPLFAFHWPARPLLLIGNEGRGVPARALERSRIVRIPQYGRVECLNAAVSAAVALYDFLGKRATLPEAGIRGAKFHPAMRANALQGSERARGEDSRRCSSPHSGANPGNASASRLPSTTAERPVA